MKSLRVTRPSRRFGHSRYFRFGWERTLVDRMPVWLRGEIERTQDRIEINPKVVLESRSFVAPTAGIRWYPWLHRRARPAPHDASSSTSALASFKSSVSKPSVNQP